MKRAMQSALRLGINRGWDSVWYAKKQDFGNYLIEDFKIREFIKKNVINSGVSKVMIERTTKKCFVTIYTSRPGFVIGKKGTDIEKIKGNLAKLTSNEVVLNIKEVKKTLSSAIANAENNFQYDIDKLIIKEAYCGKQVVMKRFRPRAKGRASPIMKPYSNLTIILTESTKDQKDKHGTKG